MPPSLYKKVGIASLIMMASVFLSRLAGLFREMAIAYIGGTKAAVDAYQVAFVIPEILNHILASGFLSVTFIPIFSQYLTDDREKEGWKIFSLIMNGFGSLLIILILISMIFTEHLVALVAPGIKDPMVINSAVRMTRIIIPAQFFFFAGGMFMAAQFAKERFAVAALAPLVYNIGIIVGGLALGQRFGMDGFAWGVLGGAFVGNFLIQLYGAKKVGMKFEFILDFTHPELIRYIKLTLPLMIGLGMAFSTEFFFKFFGSWLPEGSIAALNYALRIMFMLVAFFGQAVGVASFPFMARLAAENQVDEMNRLLNRTLRYLSLVIPLSVLLMVLRHEVILILFQRGKFDAQATQLTASLLIFLLTGAVAFAWQTVVVRGYYAMQNTLFPAVFSTLAALMSIPVYLIGINLMGIKGVALAISISAFAQVFLLYGIWNRKTKNIKSKRVYIFTGKMALCSIIIFFFLELLKKYLVSFIDPATFFGSLSISIIIGILFAAIFAGLGFFFKIEEISDLWGRVAKKIRIARL